MYIVTQHLKIDKHIHTVHCHQTQTSKTQQLVTNSFKKSKFSKDLCKILLSSNIPLYKVTNIHFLTSLEVYYQTNTK